jgi:RNA recognition motif. (a.k.a. RRM, RBD, or RNP domain)
MPLIFRSIPQCYTYADIHRLVHPRRIVSTRILKDSEGASRGIALVRLETHEIAQETTQRLNGMVSSGNQSLQFFFR